MQPFNANIARTAIGHDDPQRALANNRVFELADLIALRQIGVKIVFTVKNACQIDLRFQAKAGANGLIDTFPIDHRQHARHCRIDK